MPLPFDATLKDLVQSYLPDFAEQFDLSSNRTLRTLNVDLSTVSAATDITLGEGDPPTRIFDLNFQASRDDRLAARAFLYNALLHYRYRVPVDSVIILLRPAADHSLLTGALSYQTRPRKGKVDFRYELVRLWEWPADRFLRGGLGTLPLALLAQLPKKPPVESSLAVVVQRIFDRVHSEAAGTVAAKILTASYVLSGLRVHKDIADRVFRGVRAMRESSTYQGILEEGRVEEARKIILRQGRKRFGRAPAAVQATIEGVASLERLERLSDRLLEATSWQELLETK